MAEPSASFHVAGILVQAVPAAVPAVGERIRQLAGARVHAVDPAGRLVVTVESEDSTLLVEQLTRMQVMEGVLAAVLVSEHSEPLEAANQEIPHEPSPPDPA